MFEKDSRLFFILIHSCIKHSVHILYMFRYAYDVRSRMFSTTWDRICLVLCIIASCLATIVAGVNGVRDFVSVEFVHTFTAHVSGSCVKSINLIYITTTKITREKNKQTSKRLCTKEKEKNVWQNRKMFFLFCFR